MATPILMSDGDEGGPANAASRAEAEGPLTPPHDYSHRHRRSSGCSSSADLAGAGRRGRFRSRGSPPVRLPTMTMPPPPPTTTTTTEGAHSGATAEEDADSNGGGIFGDRPPPILQVEFRQPRHEEERLPLPPTCLVAPQQAPSFTSRRDGGGGRSVFGGDGGALPSWRQDYHVSEGHLGLGRLPLDNGRCHRPSMPATARNGCLYTNEPRNNGASIGSGLVGNGEGTTTHMIDCINVTRHSHDSQDRIAGRGKNGSKEGVHESGRENVEGGDNGREQQHYNDDAAKAAKARPFVTPGRPGPRMGGGILGTGSKAMIAPPSTRKESVAVGDEYKANQDEKNKSPTHVTPEQTFFFASGRPDRDPPSFPPASLNHAEAQAASSGLSGRSFACGSSVRHHPPPPGAPFVPPSAGIAVGFGVVSRGGRNLLRPSQGTAPLLLPPRGGSAAAAVGASGCGANRKKRRAYEAHGPLSSAAPPSALLGGGESPTPPNHSFFDGPSRPVQSNESHNNDAPSTPAATAAAAAAASMMTPPPHQASSSSSLFKTPPPAVKPSKAEAAPTSASDATGGLAEQPDSSMLLASSSSSSSSSSSDGGAAFGLMSLTLLSPARPVGVRCPAAACATPSRAPPSALFTARSAFSAATPTTTSHRPQPRPHRQGNSGGAVVEDRSNLARALDHQAETSSCSAASARSLPPTTASGGASSPVNGAAAGPAIALQAALSQSAGSSCDTPGTGTRSCFSPFSSRTPSPGPLTVGRSKHLIAMPVASSGGGASSAAAASPMATTTTPRATTMAVSTPRASPGQRQPPSSSDGWQPPRPALTPGSAHRRVALTVLSGGGGDGTGGGGMGYGSSSSSGVTTPRSALALGAGCGKSPLLRSLDREARDYGSGGGAASSDDEGEEEEVDRDDDDMMSSTLFGSKSIIATPLRMPRAALAGRQHQSPSTAAAAGDKSSKKKKAFSSGLPPKFSLTPRMSLSSDQRRPPPSEDVVAGTGIGGGTAGRAVRTKLTPKLTPRPTPPRMMTAAARPLPPAAVSLSPRGGARQSAVAGPPIPWASAAADDDAIMMGPPPRAAAAARSCDDDDEDMGAVMDGLLRGFADQSEKQQRAAIAEKNDAPAVGRARERRNEEEDAVLGSFRARSILHPKPQSPARHQRRRSSIDSIEAMLDKHDAERREARAADRRRGSTLDDDDDVYDDNGGFFLDAPQVLASEIIARAEDDRADADEAEAVSSSCSAAGRGEGTTPLDSSSSWRCSSSLSGERAVDRSSGPHARRRRRGNEDDPRVQQHPSSMFLKSSASYSSSSTSLDSHGRSVKTPSNFDARVPGLAAAAAASSNLPPPAVAAASAVPASAAATTLTAAASGQHPSTVTFSTAMDESFFCFGLSDTHSGGGGDSQQPQLQQQRSGGSGGGADGGGMRVASSFSRTSSTSLFGMEILHENSASDFASMVRAGRRPESACSMISTRLAQSRSDHSLGSSSVGLALDGIGAGTAAGGGGGSATTTNGGGDAGSVASRDLVTPPAQTFSLGAGALGKMSMLTPPPLFRPGVVASSSSSSSSAQHHHQRHGDGEGGGRAPTSTATATQPGGGGTGSSVCVAPADQRSVKLAIARMAGAMATATSSSPFGL